MKGDALCRLDRVPVYKLEAYYLVFPASVLLPSALPAHLLALICDQHSYFITSAVGFLTLLNQSARPLTLSAQQRKTENRGGTCILAPGEMKTFDYRVRMLD